MILEYLENLAPLSSLRLGSNACGWTEAGTHVAKHLFQYVFPSGPTLTRYKRPVWIRMAFPLSLLQQLMIVALCVFMVLLLALEL